MGGGRSSDNSIIFNLPSSKNWDHRVERQIKSSRSANPPLQTDEDRRAYLQFLAEEAERFGVEILVCGVEPGACWNRPKGLGLFVVQSFFPTGRSKRDALGKDRQWGGWVKKWAEFLRGTTSAKDQAIRQIT